MVVSLFNWKLNLPSLLEGKRRRESGNKQTKNKCVLKTFFKYVVLASNCLV